MRPKHSSQPKGLCRARPEGLRERCDPQVPIGQKSMIADGTTTNEGPASEKLEIIGFVEQSHLPAKITIDKLGVARRTFCRWYDRGQ